MYMEQLVVSRGALLLKVFPLSIIFFPVVILFVAVAHNHPPRRRMIRTSAHRGIPRDSATPRSTPRPPCSISP